MRTFFTIIGMFLLAQGHAQVCLEQLSSVPLSNWTTTTNVPYVNDAPYLNALNEAQYDGIWTIGSGVSNAHLSVSENASISTFIGVKRRNVVAPSDNIVPNGNVYTIETGYSPLTQNSSEIGPLAKWNFLMYINMGDYVFDDVDVRLYIDMDPCYDALVDDMVEINVSEQFIGFFGNANFGAFGINQNLASNFIQAFQSDNIQQFNPEDEGYYTLAIGIYDVCGNLKNWHEVLVNVTDATDGDGNANGITDSQEMGGCTNALACNYECTATFNDGSCEYSSCAGCTVEQACNYDPTATIPNPDGCLYPADLYGEDIYDCDGECLNDTDGDGVCDENEIGGCTDELACNFSAAATDDNGSCTYSAAGLDCEGNCLVDTDDDGVCDEFEIDGCDDPSACNFDSSATENDGSCDYVTCEGCTVVEACNYDASATISSTALCIYAEGCDSCSGEQDGTGTVVDNDLDDDGVCDADELSGCTDSAACDYNPAATEDAACDYESCKGCTLSAACNFDASATIANNSSCLFAEGICDVCSGETDGSGFVTNNDADDDGVCDADEVSGCTNEAACNYDTDATEDDGSCETQSCAGCTLSLACNYNASATIANNGSCLFAEGNCDVCSGETDGSGFVINNDADDDGVCDADEVSGCTNAAACNYDTDATEDDGSCETQSCAGCTLSLACNYNASATISNNGTCVFPESALISGTCETCSGETDGTGVVVNNDADNDGTCDDDEILGCTTAGACNYNPEATESDSSCDFTSCIGCLNPAACNYDASATIASTCIFPAPFSDCDGCLEDSNDNDICDQLEASGCTDITANNFDPFATIDDNSCTYPSVGCMLPWAPNYDPNAEFQGFPVSIVCFAAQTPSGSPTPLGLVTGCADTNACNYLPGGDPSLPCDYDCFFGCQNENYCDYDPDAPYPGPCTDLTSCYGCTVSTACNFDEANTFEDGTCEYETCTGCTDPTACNYNSSSTINVGCVFATGCDFCSGESDGSGVIVDGDADFDGVCDIDEIEGCMNASACNYNPAATDSNGTCEYLSCAGCMDPLACNYDSEATINVPSDCLIPVGCDFCSEGQIADGDADNDGVCDADEVPGCMNVNACNYNGAATNSDGSCEFTSCEGCINALACNYDASATIPAPSTCVFATGCETCSGETDGTGTVVDNDSDNDGVCDADEVPGCMNANACNYNGAATNSDGSCEFTSCEGCMNALACNYDASATIPAPSTCVFATGCETCSGGTDGTGTVVDNDSDNDGVCDADEVPGCMNVEACNYNPLATNSNGSCEFSSCIGCLIPEACNYEGDDPTITLNEPIQCIFPEPGLDCDGNCLNDADGDLICDEDEVQGCQDDSACNYNPAATDDDGNCTYPDEFEDCEGNCLVDEDGDGVCDQLEIYGCTVVLSCNFDPTVTENDGSCDFETCVGCKNAEACNYDSEAILSDPLLCIFDTNPELVFDAVLEISDAPAEWPNNDYLTSSEGAVSVAFEDYTGRLNDGRYHVTRIYTATSLCGVDKSCGQLLIAAADQPNGCTNLSATNYDASAVNDDGSCSYDPACLGDLNDDSIIGASDLLIMLSSFGLPCE